MDKKHGGLFHGLLMMLCCLIPIVLIFAFSRFGASSVLSYGFLLLCPLMHIFMMKGMLGGHDKESCHGDKNSESEKKLNDEPQKIERLEENA